MKFCTSCGSSVTLRIPEGDDRERFVCTSCESVHYINPRVIVGCLPVHESRVLLCKRAIEPRYGYWTLPAGFMENGETTPQGAARETWEEARGAARPGPPPVPCRWPGALPDIRHPLYQPGLHVLPLPPC